MHLSAWLSRSAYNARGLRPDTVNTIERLTVPVSGNMTQFPVDIHKLKNLRELRAINEKIKSLPFNITRMTPRPNENYPGLQILDIHRNSRPGRFGIQKFPINFAQLTGLTQIDVSGNRLSTFENLSEGQIALVMRNLSSYDRRQFPTDPNVSSQLVAPLESAWRSCAQTNSCRPLADLYRQPVINVISDIGNGRRTPTDWDNFRICHEGRRFDDVKATVERVPSSNAWRNQVLNCINLGEGASLVFDRATSSQPSPSATQPSPSTTQSSSRSSSPSSSDSGDKYFDMLIKYYKQP